MQGLVYKEDQASKLSLEEQVHSLTKKVEELQRQLLDLNQRTASMRRIGVVAGGAR